MHNALMIAVSTAQNVINVVPALQEQVSQFVFIETPFAQNKDWSNGATEVLNNHEIAVREPIKLCDEASTSIDLLEERLKNYVNQNTDHQIIWNLGGGQKIQQLAVWRIFSDRVRAGMNDRACYEDAHSHKIVWFHRQKSDLGSYAEKIDSDLNINELIRIFNFRFNDSGELLYHQKESYALKEPDNFFAYREFREFCFNAAAFGPKEKEKTENKLSLQWFDEKLKDSKEKIADTLEQAFSNGKINLGNLIREEYRRNPLNQIANITTKRIAHEIKHTDNTFQWQFRNAKLIELLKPLINNTDKAGFSDFEQITGFKGFGRYFESILSAYIQQLAQQYPDNAIQEIRTNVRVGDSTDQREIAEHDILIATRWGTIFSLDAKTFSVKQKDRHARMYNLFRSAGIYGRIAFVFPAFHEDLSTDYYPEDLRALGYELKQSNQPFYVYTDTETDLSTTYKGEKITLKPIKQFFFENNLIKNNKL